MLKDCKTKNNILLIFFSSSCPPCLSLSLLSRWSITDRNVEANTAKLFVQKWLVNVRGNFPGNKRYSWPRHHGEPIQEERGWALFDACGYDQYTFSVHYITISEVCKQNVCIMKYFQKYAKTQIWIYFSSSEN